MLRNALSSGFRILLFLLEREKRKKKCTEEKKYKSRKRLIFILKFNHYNFVCHFKFDIFIIMPHGFQIQIILAFFFVDFKLILLAMVRKKCS